MPPRSVLSLLAVAGLGAFYLALAYAAAHPRVSAEYRAHYLERTADCWLPDDLQAAGPDLPADVALDRLDYPDACLYLRIGWWPLDRSDAWTHPGTATLRLPWRPRADAVELLLQGPPAAPDPIEAEIDVGPETVHATLPPGEQRSVQVPLPPMADQRAWQVQFRMIGSGTVKRANPALPPRNVGLGLVRLHYLDLPGGGSERK